jgi:hypothetical protein
VPLLNEKLLCEITKSPNKIKVFPDKEYLHRDFRFLPIKNAGIPKKRQF